MDKIKNPFSPGAGSLPPEMAGRDSILEQADVLLGRVLAKRPEKSVADWAARSTARYLRSCYRPKLNAMKSEYVTMCCMSSSYIQTMAELTAGNR